MDSKVFCLRLTRNLINRLMKNQKSDPDFGFFISLLIDSTLGQARGGCLPDAFGTAAIQMFGAPRDGRFNLKQQEFADWHKSYIKSLSCNVEFFNFRILKQYGDFVQEVALNNADFVSQICAFGPDRNEVIQALENYKHAAFEYIKNFICKLIISYINIYIGQIKSSIFWINATLLSII